MGWKDWAVIRMKTVHCLFFDMAQLFSVINDQGTLKTERDGQTKGER